MHRTLLTALTALFLVGCEPTSRIDPDVPLDELLDAEVAQLCRFTVDVLADAEPGCSSFTPDYDTCRAAPPWVACPAGDRDADVGSWETCVRASQRCTATADECWHVACL